MLIRTSKGFLSQPANRKQKAQSSFSNLLALLDVAGRFTFACIVSAHLAAYIFASSSPRRRLRLMCSSFSTYCCQSTAVRDANMRIPFLLPNFLMKVCSTFASTSQRVSSSSTDQTASSPAKRKVITENLATASWSTIPPKAFARPRKASQSYMSQVATGVAVIFCASVPRRFTYNARSPSRM